VSGVGVVAAVAACMRGVGVVAACIGHVICVLCVRDGVLRMIHMRIMCRLIRMRSVHRMGRRLAAVHRRFLPILGQCSYLVVFLGWSSLMLVLHCRVIVRVYLGMSLCHTQLPTARSCRA